MSDWLTASRCVDEYFLILWKKNTAKESSQKLSIANKGTVSFIAEVEACIEYNFAMEFVENDLLKTVSLEIKTSKSLNRTFTSGDQDLVESMISEIALGQCMYQSIVKLNHV